jgi:hypothetical protein
MIVKLTFLFEVEGCAPDERFVPFARLGRGLASRGFVSIKGDVC